MKASVVLAVLLTLCCCTQPIQNTPKVYKGTSYFNLEYHKTWIAAERLSSWNTKPVDTPLLAYLHREVKSDSGTYLQLRYSISTEKGEQYHFEIPNKLKVWLHANSMFILSYYDLSFTHPLFVSGESYIETLDSLTLDLGDSLTVSLEKGSCLNLRNHGEDSLIRISLIRGVATVQGDYGNCSNKATLKKSGHAVNMNKSGAVGEYRLFDTTQRIAWRDGRYLLAGDSILNDILIKVSGWHNLQFSVSNKIRKNSKTRSPLTLTYTTPIAVILKKIETAFDVRIDITRNSIFIY